MRSMSSTGICDSDGLKGPPTGTPSTVTRSASNSFRPQRPMLARRGPLSDPLAVSRPVTSCSASTTVRAPRRRSSSPVTTDTAPGTLTGSSAPFVAETTTCSVVESGVGAGVGAGACADACLLARRRRKPAAAQARSSRFMFVPFCEVLRGAGPGRERASDPGWNLGWSAWQKRTGAGARCRRSLGSDGAGGDPLRSRAGVARTGAWRTLAVLLHPIAFLTGIQRSGKPAFRGFLRPPFSLPEHQRGRRLARRRKDLEGNARRVFDLLSVEAVADRQPRAAGGQVRDAPQEHSGARGELRRHTDRKLPALDRQEQLQLRDSPRKSTPLDPRRLPRPHRPEDGRSDGNLR